MKELQEYKKAKRTLEARLSDIKEELRTKLKDMLLLRNDEALNENANDEVLRSIDKSWKITASLENLSDTLEIKILEQSVSYNRFVFDGVRVLISNFLNYEEQKALIAKLGFDLNEGE